MAIHTDDELAHVASEVSTGLAAIQAYLGERNCEAGKVQFPWSYIRKASTFRAQLWFLRDEVVRRNLAYAHIQSDTLRWLLNRTTLTGTAREMIIKESVCLSAAICESLTKVICRQERLCGEGRGFKPRCDTLRVQQAISERTAQELKWLWDFRQNEHIFLAPDWEYGYYKMAHGNRAVKALHSLKAELNEWFTKDLPF
jgi:hypothetical protein